MPVRHGLRGAGGVGAGSNSVLLLLLALGCTWTPKVCKIMAFWAVFSGFGPLFFHTSGVQVGMIPEASRGEENEFPAWAFQCWSKLV